jgi:hypothetical protein
MYEYRCDERLKAKAEGSTRLAYTHLVVVCDCLLFVVERGTGSSQVYLQ